MEFEYRAKDQTGRTVTGVMTADDEDGLADLLDAQSLFLIEASPARKKEASGRLFERIRMRDVLVFTGDLATMMGVGISLTSALRDLAEGTEKIKMRHVILDLVASVESGSSLSAAFERHPKVFDEVYTNIIRAGEDSGNLDRVLASLSEFLEWKGDLRRDIGQALIYPGMVLTTVFGLIILLATVVFPSFSQVLRQSSGPMPIPTRVLFGLSEFLVAYWWAVLILIAVSAVGFALWIRTDRGRMRFDGWALRAPIFGHLVRDIALSRFCHFFQILFGAGVDISQTLSILERVVGNRVLAAATAGVRTEIRAGESIARSLESTGAFPPMIVRVFRIGESSGQLDGSLAKACRYYDKEIPATIKRAFAMLEPVLYIFLAFIVLMVALAIYLPLYQMMQTFSR
jgi:type IV pilus assembly protein PilC